MRSVDQLRGSARLMEGGSTTISFLKTRCVYYWMSDYETSADKVLRIQHTLKGAKPGSKQQLARQNSTTEQHCDLQPPSKVFGQRWTKDLFELLTFSFCKVVTLNIVTVRRTQRLPCTPLPVHCHKMTSGWLL